MLNSLNSGQRLVIMDYALNYWLSGCDMRTVSGQPGAVSRIVPTIAAEFNIRFTSDLYKTVHQIVGEVYYDCDIRYTNMLHRNNVPVKG